MYKPMNTFTIYKVEVCISYAHMLFAYSRKLVFRIYFDSLIYTIGIVLDWAVISLGPINNESLEVKILFYLSLNLSSNQ